MLEIVLWTLAGVGLFSLFAGGVAGALSDGPNQREWEGASYALFFVFPPVGLVAGLLLLGMAIA